MATEAQNDKTEKVEEQPQEEIITDEWEVVEEEEEEKEEQKPQEEEPQCPFCGSIDLSHDPAVNVYVCNICGRAWTVE